jgi:hypothetical protein
MMGAGERREASPPQLTSGPAPPQTHLDVRLVDEGRVVPEHEVHDHQHDEHADDGGLQGVGMGMGMGTERMRLASERTSARMCVARRLPRGSRARSPAASAPRSAARASGSVGLAQGPSACAFRLKIHREREEESVLLPARRTQPIHSSSARGGKGKGGREWERVSNFSDEHGQARVRMVSLEHFSAPWTPPEYDAITHSLPRRRR